MAEMFTPGPWRAGSFSSIVGVPVMAQPDKTKNTFNVCGVAAPVSREENIANAHLIAAAPSLYEALRELRASCTRTAPAVHDDCGTRIVAAPTMDALKAASAALARARGETVNA